MTKSAGSPCGSLARELGELGLTGDSPGPGHKNYSLRVSCFVPGIVVQGRLKGIKPRRVERQALGMPGEEEQKAVIRRELSTGGAGPETSRGENYL